MPSNTLYSQSEARTKNVASSDQNGGGSVINPRRIVDYISKGQIQPGSSSLPATTKSNPLRNQSSPHSQAQNAIPESVGLPISRGAQSHSPKAIAQRIYQKDMNATGMAFNSIPSNANPEYERDSSTGYNPAMAATFTGGKMFNIRN